MFTAHCTGLILMLKHFKKKEFWLVYRFSFYPGCCVCIPSRHFYFENSCLRRCIISSVNNNMDSCEFIPGKKKFHELNIGWIQLRFIQRHYTWYYITHAWSQKFNWFVDNDFLYFQSGWLSKLCFGLYVIILIVYVVKEINLVRFSGKFNLPKILLWPELLCRGISELYIFNGDLILPCWMWLAMGFPIWHWYGCMEESRK